MKNLRLMILPAMLMAISTLASCNVTRNPNEKLIRKAKQYYSQLRVKENIAPGEDYKAWYFDPESLKGVAFENEKDYKYLGILNIQNLTFSEVEKTHFLDLPNYKITLNDDLSFEMPPELNFENPADFLKQMPLVLVEDSKTDISTSKDVYSKINVDESTKEVSLSQSATADNYSADLFFINNFGYDIKDGDNLLFSFDYRDCSMALLKRDLLTFIDEALNSQDSQETNKKEANEGEQSSEMPFNIDLYKSLLKSYNKANNLTDTPEKMVNSHLEIPGYFGVNPETNEKYPVAIGPMGFQDIFKSNSLKDVTSVTLNEGVKKVSFYAFDKSNIKEVSFPKTIRQIDFTSFSRMNQLEKIYIPNTSEEIDIFHTNQGSISKDFDGPDGQKINVTIADAFDGSTIQNVVFENYDNVNLHNFSIDSFDVPETTRASDLFTFVDSDGQSQYKTLDEAFNTKGLTSFNTAFMLDEEASNHLTNKNIDVINEDQNLYISHTKGDGFGRLLKDDSQYHEMAYYGDESLNPTKQRIVTFDIENDLTIKGKVVVGGVTGEFKLNEKNPYKTNGLVNGKYGAIDLKGHTIIVDGGVLDCNGIIEDSVGGGKVIVKNNGVLKANLTVYDNYDYSNYSNKIKNDEFPYHFYDFGDINVPVTIEATGRLIAKETVTKNAKQIVSKEIFFAGKKLELYEQESSKLKDPYIELCSENASLEINKVEDENNLLLNGNKTTLNLFGDVKINRLDTEYKNQSGLGEFVESDTMFYPITSKTIDVIAKKGSNVSLLVNAKFLNDSKFIIEEGAKLGLNKNIIVYPSADEIKTSIKTPDLGKTHALFINNGEINFENNDTYSIFFGGSIISKMTDNLRVLLNSTRLKPGGLSREGGNNNKGNYAVAYQIKENINVYEQVNDTLEKRYYRSNSGYYYEYNSAGDTSINNAKTSNSLAKKTSNGTWTIYADGKSVLTDVNGPTINQYVVKDGEIITESYILNDAGTWESGKSDYNAELKIYTKGEHSYVYFKGQEFIEGQLVKDKISHQINKSKLIFKSLVGDSYFYSEIEQDWIKVHLYEHDEMIAYLTNDNVKDTTRFNPDNYSKYVLYNRDLNNYSTYTNADFSYNQTYHYITDNKSTEPVYKVPSKRGFIDVELASQTRLIFKQSLSNNYYIYAEDLKNSDDSYYERIVNSNFDPKTTCLVTLENRLVYGYTTNQKWEQGLEHSEGMTAGFRFFQITGESDITKNFALYDENGGEPIYKVFIKASSILINKDELDEGLAGLLPEGDNRFIGYRYIIIDGVKKAFVTFEQGENASQDVKLVQIADNTVFKEKEEFIKKPGDKITIVDAFQLLVFKHNNESLFIDFNKSITCGDPAEDLSKGNYLALAVYTNRDLLSELIPDTGPIPGPGPYPVPKRG